MLQRYPRDTVLSKILIRVIRTSVLSFTRDRSNMVASSSDAATTMRFPISADFLAELFGHCGVGLRIRNMLEKRDDLQN